MRFNTCLFQIQKLVLNEVWFRQVSVYMYNINNFSIPLLILLFVRNKESMQKKTHWNYFPLWFPQNIWYSIVNSPICIIQVEFPIPIVACNLMIEYADFYDNLQATAETLQCPRCSASVPATPGVCGNCGENVFQCHKCRYV